MTRNRDLRWDEMSIRDILELAIADEHDAESYYLRAAHCAGDPHTRVMFERLAEMEHGHALTLARELEELETQRECETGMAD